MKQIVVIVGSPRKNGNTELLANALIRGAQAAGHTVDKLSVVGRQIHGCIGCNACYKSEAHQCIWRDDMDDCYARLAKADVIVLATPIYFYCVSAQVKALIDRLHNPIRSTFHAKKLALLAVCADEDDAVFDAVRAMYNAVRGYFSLTDGGTLTVSGVYDKGDIAGNPALQEAEAMGRRL